MKTVVRQSSPTIHDLIADYLDHVARTGSRLCSLAQLRCKLKPFARYLDETGLDPLSLRARDAIGYQRFLLERKTKAGAALARKSVNLFTLEAKNFCRWLVDHGLAAANPFDGLRSIREWKRLPRNVLKEAQLEELLCELEKYDDEPKLWLAMRRYRAHAVCELLYSTGMRIGEAEALRVSDINFEKREVSIRDGKSGKLRVGFLNEYAAFVLRLYVERARQWLGHARRADDTLFGAGFALELQTNRVLKETCERLGFPPVRSHGFRHAYGSHMLRAGCDIRHIQEMLGHERLRTTQVYTKIEKEDLREVLDKFHPRQWNVPAEKME